MENYDVIVIGGGAGLKIGRPAADLGFKVAVIEKEDLGGTCLNRGCIPSKMLIHPADVIMQMRESDLYNIHIDGPIQIDTQKLVHYVTETVSSESKSINPAYEKHPNIDLYTDEAQFTAPKTLKVGSKTLTGDKIFITVGARPHIPDIAGLNGTPYLTSTELLRLEKLPKSISIIGGGYIACELGHYLDAMGVKVRFILRSKFMRSLDVDIQTHFQSHFEKRFEISYMEPQKVSYENDQFKIEAKGSSVTSEALLVATGVTPNSDLLNLSSTDVKVNDKGYIQVNDYLETTEPSVYAFGDIIGRWLFRHSANFEGEYLFNAQFKDPSNSAPISYPPVPYGVFTWPQIGGVGKTERELQDEKRDYYVGINAYQHSAMGMALQKDEGLVKLLFDAKTDQLIGGHIVGEQAATMLHMIIAYMSMNATLFDLLRTIYIHPALPENIRNAARKALQNKGEEKC